jgi:hypothetical protein
MKQAKLAGRLALAESDPEKSWAMHILALRWSTLARIRTACAREENGASARLMVASLGLPHWLMIAGTLLVVAGFVGVLVSGKKAKELESSSDEPTDASHQQMPPLPSLLDSRPKNNT